MRNATRGVGSVLAFTLFAVVASAPPGAAAQDKPTLGADDYDQWESLGSATLSPDGLWLAVVVRRVDESSELRVHRTDSDSVVIVPEGSRPEFGADGGWLAYAIGVSPDERDDLEEKGDPVRNGVGLLDLRTGDREEIEAVQSFSFSDDGRHVALRRYGAPDSESDGTDVIVRQLAGGGSMSFGNVSALAWQEGGNLLAMLVDASDRVGNGVRLYDAESGRIRSLDADEATYRELSWREDAPDLAVLKTYEDEAHEDTAHVALAWRDLDTDSPRAFRLDPRESSDLPAGTRIVEHRAPTWSDDGSTLFLGVKERVPVEVAAGDSEEEEEGDAASGDDGEDGGDEESPGVEIWHSLDVDPVPQQRVREDQLRREHDIGAWHPGEGEFLFLGGDHADRTEIAGGGRHVLARDETPYDMDAMFRQQFHDVYAVDARTGGRELVRERVTIDMGASPGGRYAVWFEGADYWTHDLTTGETRNVTTGLGGTFVDLDRTPTREQMGPFGIAGWLEDDAALLVNDRFDVWEVSPDGAGGRRLTAGAEGEVRHRVVTLDPDADAFDPDEPLYYSTYGEWTKQAGFSLSPRGEMPEPLIWADASFSRGLLKAEDADVYAFRQEQFDNSPDYYVAGPRLDEARQVTRTNPFQDDHAWGTTQLIEYENEWGRRLQGSLVYPANYDPDETYPMIVYHYELLSQTLHQYQVPDPTRYYNVQIWSQEGYFVLMPDIVYRDRRPGQSNVETLRPAVAAAVETGMIDPERVGLIGHSWGGYQTTFFVTQDDLFAGAVAGAPLTNLMSMYLSFYWNSGGTDARIFEISQGRMQVPWWEDWDSYHANSPLHHIENLNTPLLIEFGTEDGAVEFNQGVEFYNAARRAGKQMVMLVYEGENHGLAKEPNQRDYQSRILQWFAHYLKGEPAPEWITSGVPYLEQKDGLKKKKKVS
ncbi:prolyl oligopeptidase family serine peptidase [Candidatus Palauibacter sp.]|uniref:prolyl oligopeptidase family serine peptidase n=1 Tax=Candidatus Palauibacter sp. TaxID=3101350 RepID=UPI003AF2AB8A